MENNYRTNRTKIIKESFNIQTKPISETNRTKTIKESFKPTNLKENFESLKKSLLDFYEKIKQNSNSDEQNKKSLETKIQKQESSSDEIPRRGSQLHEPLIW